MNIFKRLHAFYLKRFVAPIVFQWAYSLVLHEESFDFTPEDFPFPFDRRIWKQGSMAIQADSWFNLVAFDSHVDLKISRDDIPVFQATYNLGDVSIQRFHYGAWVEEIHNLVKESRKKKNDQIQGNFTPQKLSD